MVDVFAILVGIAAWAAGQYVIGLICADLDRRSHLRGLRAFKDQDDDGGK